MVSIVETHPNLIEEWDYERNTLDPALCSAGSQRRAYWVCSKSQSHRWVAQIRNRVNGTNCPYCAGQKACVDNCLATLNPEVAEQWHPTLNGQLTPWDVTGRSHKKIHWICERKHGWQSAVNDRARGNDCPYCAGVKVCFDNCLATLYPEVAKQWHPTLNGQLTPWDVTVGSDKKVYWQCNNHHIWRTKVNHKVKGRNCPYCNLSKGEEAVREALLSLNVTFRQEFQLKRKGAKALRFDFAVAVGHRRGLIEYQGIQHYECVDRFGGQPNFLKRQQLDHVKRQTCIRLNLPFLEIPYWELDNVDSLVAEFIKSMI